MGGLFLAIFNFKKIKFLDKTGNMLTRKKLYLFRKMVNFKSLKTK